MRSDLVFYIKRMGNQLERMSYQYGQAAGNREISLMNLWVVDFLFDNQDREIFPRDIEEEFSITRATASKMLNLMETKELIARKRVEGDGRMKQIVLLPGGFRLQKEAVRVRNRMEEQICRNLTPKEREQFQMLSRKILAGMGD